MPVHGEYRHLAANRELALDMGMAPNHIFISDIGKVLEIDPGDFNDPSLMTLAKQLYISSEMTAYVRGEIARKEAGESYDPDAFDHQTGEPLSFTK